MKFLNILSSSIFQILSFIFVLGYLLGFLNLHFSDKTNYCVMTYMFEYPQFVRLSVPENNIYPQYGLYAYSEGRFTEKARRMWFDGVPVLFLPGNSGSHMQARSLASVALRKALTKGYQYHFDFFTISYNEELSGLYGGVLQSQTKFAAACISKILSLYKGNKYTKSVPNSIILIGHSMGGLIAKRLLAYPSTINTTSVAITLAAPLEAPVVNVDAAMDDYYMLMNLEWNTYINNDADMKQKKILISFGNGPRDVLMPSGLTSSNDSYINTLTTSVPGVWTSPDHVSIVWCKQLVMVINSYLFSIVDPVTEQVVEDSQILKSKATHFFKANRSMILSPDIPRANITMLADAFWYEDNRRIYQISRPQIEKTTYLMIRLVAFPQNRFVAIEAVNLADRDWVFGCNAKYTYNTYRYCKDAQSLSELSRWTAAATDFGKRKLATINLHKVKEMHPDWSHVIVKVSPTRKPIILNVDINDHASRVVDIELLYLWSFGMYIIIPETERDSLYYELILKDFNTLDEAYLLYVEPTASCKTQYHVSAELHVPWAENHEYYHYFTHIKQSPMKLRLFKSNPNLTNSDEVTEHAKITLLLDPQCRYKISISASFYHRLAQFARNYSPVLVPYMTAIVLLAARSNIMQLQEKGACISLHSALMSEGVKPYYALLYARFGALVFFSIPAFSFIFENASWNNLELRYFIKSLLVLPAYLTALGIMHIAAAAVVAVMVFSSQIAHRLFFRIMWRGGTGLAEKVASGLQKVPMVVSVGLLCAAPLSCGAASLVAGAAFYAFMLSKMYEEYLEDYVYRLLAKIFAKVCRIFKSKKSNKKAEIERLKASSSAKEVSLNDNSDDKNNARKLKRKDSLTTGVTNHGKKNDTKTIHNSEKKKEDTKTKNNSDGKNYTKIIDGVGEKTCDDDKKDNNLEIDEDLSSLNFHMMMFSMWLAVTLVNVPALLTWARNFSYSMVLKPDTSYHTGLVMSACSTCVWQMNLPRRNLRYYEPVSALLFTMAVFLLALGPLSLTIVNYGVTFMFAVITVQQVLDKEENIPSNEKDKNTKETPTNNDESNGDEKVREDKDKAFEETETIPGTDIPLDDCNVCNENRIYRLFKNIREKFSATENL